MSSKKKSDWEVKVYGNQLDEIDIDLIVQVVVMLGRQLAEEAADESPRKPTNGQEEE